jgi:sugar (pentulose or hexulose) kinase
MAGTPNLDWICEVTGQGYQNWADVEAEASSSGPGGVVYLPYGALSGERAPFVDAAASAALLGLSVTTTRAQLLSAVYHGIAMSLRECTEVLGIDRPLSIGGGGATSKLLCQAIADATGRPTARLPGVEVGARGAGALALVGAGLAEDVGAAVTKLADHVETHEPDLARRAYYDDQFAAFRAARDAIRPVWPVLRNLKNGPSPAR